MKRTLCPAIFLPALAVAVAMLLPCPSLNAASEEAAWQTELESWRAPRATNLQAPEGWLSLIGLAWLQEGDNTFGADDDNRIQINAKVAGHVGVVRLAKGKVRLLPPTGGFPKDFQVDGHPAKEQDLVADD